LIEFNALVVLSASVSLAESVLASLSVACAEVLNVSQPVKTAVQPALSPPALCLPGSLPSAPVPVSKPADLRAASNFADVSARAVLTLDKAASSF